MRAAANSGASSRTGRLPLRVAAKSKPALAWRICGRGTLSMSTFSWGSPHNMLPCLQGALSRSPSPALMVTEMRTLFQALRCLVRARRMQMVRSPSRRRMSGAAMCTKLREQIPFAPMLSTCLCSEQENLSISLLSQEIEYHLFVIVAS